MINRRYILSLSVAMVCCTGLFAQSNVITSNRTAAQSRINIEEKLVRLALANNPEGKIAVYKTTVAELAVKQEQRWFMETVRISGNLNEFSMNPETYVRSQYYPRYNFGISFTVGELFNRPSMVRTRRVESEISKLESEGTKQNIRTEVLKRYNHYLFAKDRLVIQKKLDSEIGINMELAKSKFNKGSESYDVLSALMEKYYTLQIMVKEMEESVNEAKLDLEAIIGVNLETVVQD